MIQFIKYSESNLNQNNNFGSYKSENLCFLTLMKLIVIAAVL